MTRTETSASPRTILIWMCVRRTALALGGLVAVAGNILCAYAPTYLALVGARWRSTPPGMNAVAISTYRMLSDFGYVVGPIALGVLADAFGAEVALTAAAALLAGTGVIFARYAPEPHRGAF